MSEPRIFDFLTESRIDERVRISLLGANVCAAFSIAPKFEKVERARS